MTYTVRVDIKKVCGDLLEHVGDADLDLLLRGDTRGVDVVLK